MSVPISYLPQFGQPFGFGQLGYSQFTGYKPILSEDMSDESNWKVIFHGADYEPLKLWSPKIVAFHRKEATASANAT